MKIPTGFGLLDCKVAGRLGLMDYWANCLMGIEESTHQPKVALQLYSLTASRHNSR